MDVWNRPAAQLPLCRAIPFSSRRSYDLRMAEEVPSGTVHSLPTDLRKVLVADSKALDGWKDVTPLARQ